MDLAPLDDREVPQNVDECLADAFASVHYAENRLIDAQASLEKVVPSIYSSARTELAKLLIYGLFRKIRVLAQDGIDARKAYDELVAKWTPLAPAVVRSLEEAGNQLLTFYEFPRAREVKILMRLPDFRCSRSWKGVNC